MTTLNYFLHEEKESIVLENAASKNSLGHRTGCFLWGGVVSVWFMGDFFERNHRIITIVIVFDTLNRIQRSELFSLAQEFHICAVELLLS